MVSQIFWHYKSEFVKLSDELINNLHSITCSWHVFTNSQSKIKNVAKTVDFQKHFAAPLKENKTFFEKKNRWLVDSEFVKICHEQLRSQQLLPKYVSGIKWQMLTKELIVMAPITSFSTVFICSTWSLISPWGPFIYYEGTF